MDDGTSTNESAEQIIKSLKCNNNCDSNNDSLLVHDKTDGSCAKVQQFQYNNIIIHSDTTVINDMSSSMLQNIEDGNTTKFVDNTGDPANFSSFFGSCVKKNVTKFRIFAPNWDKVFVVFAKKIHQFKNNTAEYFELACENNNQHGNIFSGEIKRNLDRYYYYYQLERNTENDSENQKILIVDPYAHAVVHAKGPGIILSKVRRHFVKFNPPARHKLIISEAHVRDVIQNIYPEDKVQNLGFEKLRQYIQNSDNYFSQLGVNAVELQPIQEFDNIKKFEYHWGYMPVQYFAPASAYALNPKRASQVDEFYNLVQEFHRKKIAVIMDVVYNHVGSPNYLHMINDGYFFRKNDEGFLLNYSGCGNDLHTEMPMVRHLIFNSLKHFITEYDVDGFRFDLAELIGIDFIEEIRIELQKIKPSLIMIVEPWSFRGYVGNNLQNTGLLGWNDEFRNFIKDYVWGANNLDALEYFLNGSVAFRSSFPAQSVNYLSSHDDFCWLDAITQNSSNNGQVPTLDDVKRTHIAACILLLAIGVPMLSEGLDFLHSKSGVSNTYQRGDLNAINYVRKNEYILTHIYIKRLIKFRMNNPLLCLSEKRSERYVFRKNSQENNSAGAFVFNATGEMGKNRILLVINPHDQVVHFDMSELNMLKWKQIANVFTFDLNLESQYSWNNDILEMPRLSCGIWINT